MNVKYKNLKIILCVLATLRDNLSEVSGFVFCHARAKRSIRNVEPLSLRMTKKHMLCPNEQRKN
ncbi:hypothetical protein GGR21_001132 [Dysgonomonas hofstadii]|uniref:Uncharacterized protein n=1 Tax=Dysgonomonas hofstadii TaxID=637886 RepID=A0A840CU72_9BACT|nr:hypothetical protein [Dysgonomonas hofstadii]